MSSAPKTRPEASEEEEARYLQAANTVQSALDDAIALLDERRMAPGVTSDERSLITSNFENLERDLARLQSEVQAFLADQAAVIPPSSEEVASLRVIAADLDNMTEDAVRGESVLAVTTDLASAWRGIEGADSESTD